MKTSHKIDKKLKYLIDDPLDQIHDNDIDIKSNQIYLMGVDNYVTTLESGETNEPGVEYVMANKFIKNMNILMRKGSEPILIHMKSSGGDWQEGMAIYDMIKACPNLVTILNYTHARSMSSIILQAANKRMMLPNSIFMFHAGELGFEGTFKQAQSFAEFEKLSLDTMLDIYITNLRRGEFFKTAPISRIRAWLIGKMNKKEDVFLTAKEALTYGFVDGIFGLDGTYDWGGLLEYTPEQLQV